MGNYIYVRVDGGVIGYPIESIAKCEMEYKKLLKLLEKTDTSIDYWDYFNWYFADSLEGKIATGYSVY